MGHIRLCHCIGLVSKIARTCAEGRPDDLTARLKLSFSAAPTVSGRCRSGQGCALSVAEGRVPEIAALDFDRGGG